MQELKNCLGLRIKTDPAQAVLFVCAIRRSGGHRARASGHPTGNGHRYARQATAVLAHADMQVFTTLRSVQDACHWYAAPFAGQQINTCKSNTLCMGKFGQSRQFQHIEGISDCIWEYFDTTTTIYKYTSK